MAKAEEVERDHEVVLRAGKDLVSQEMIEAAEDQALRQKKEAGTKGVGVIRKRGGRGKVELQDSNVPYPVEVHGEDFEFYGPSGFGAFVPEGVETQPYAADQEFVIKPDRVDTLKFDKPGRNLPKKRLYTVKAIHKDGRLVQLPFEAQIQNNAGGDPADAIGLRRYQRKGMAVLIDWDTLVPIYCAARDCWAQAAQEGHFVGFCTLRHAQHTMPNQYKDAGAIGQGLLSQGVTTSAVWGA